MTIAWLRDLAITIVAFVAAALLLLNAVLTIRLYRKLTPTLDRMKEASSAIKELSVMFRDEGARPAILPRKSRSVHERDACSRTPCSPPLV